MSTIDFVTRLWRRTATGAGASLEKLTSTGFVATAVVTADSVVGEEPVALAAVLFNGGRQGPGLVTLVRPAHATTDERVMGGMDAATRSDIPPIGRALARFDALCARRIVAAFDLEAQMAVLAKARGPRVSMAPQLGLDTRRLARAVGLEDVSASELAARLAVPVAKSVSAVEAEARATGEVLLALVPRLRAHGARTLRDLLDLQRSGHVTA